MLLASRAEARADQSDVVPGLIGHRDKAAILAGLSFRNGDWLVVDGLGMVVVFDPPLSDRCVAATVRGEVGIGGSAVAIGLATNAGSTSCAWDDFSESGIATLEARVERTYGPTGWRRTEYVGAQVSLAIPWWWRPSLAWMFNVHDAADNHVQVGLGLGF
jgi:hypothetical protein